MSYAPLDSESLFSSAFMAGPLPWAVWTAILASKDRHGVTALNPEALARMWKIPLDEVRDAWAVHCAPDPLSKNKEHEGRRLIPTDDGRWLVVSHEHYRDKHRDEKRREQLRLAKQRQREREKAEKEAEKHLTPPEEAAKAFVPEESGLEDDPELQEVLDLMDGKKDAPVPIEHQQHDWLDE